MSNFKIDLPAFVWVFIIGMAVCFLLGYFREEKVQCHTRDGMTKIVRHTHYGYDFICLTAGGFGLAVALTMCRYSIRMPRFWLWKCGLFVFVIFVLIAVFLLLWGTAYVASTLSMDHVRKEDEMLRRKHHRREVR